jgi:hypothetical protein
MVKARKHIEPDERFECVCPLCPKHDEGQPPGDCKCVPCQCCDAPNRQAASAAKDKVAMLAPRTLTADEEWEIQDRIREFDDASLAENISAAFKTLTTKIENAEKWSYNIRCNYEAHIRTPNDHSLQAADDAFEKHRATLREIAKLANLMGSVLAREA